MLRAFILFVGLATTEAYAAESSGMPQLNPDVWIPQIFWLIITFGFLYLIISKIVFPRLSESIEQRNDYVSDLLDEAKSLSQQTEELNKEYEEFIINSKKEAQEIILNGRKKLNIEFDKKKSELDKKISDLTSKAEQEINDFKSKSIDQIKIIANEISNELLNELSLKDTIDNNALIKNIDTISKKRMGDLN